jgi:hypothetical protein
MFYKYFVFIKEVIRNYLTSFIIKETYYLVIIGLNIINLRFPFISRVNSYKYLILRI